MSTALLTLPAAAAARTAAAMLATGAWHRYETTRIAFANGNAMYLAAGPVPDELDILWAGAQDPGGALLDLALTADCLWRANPRLRARLIVPYLPYSRSVQAEDGASLGAAVLLRLLDALPALDEYAVFDPHAPQVVGFSRRPMRVLSCLPDVADWAGQRLGPVDVVVAPDSGRARACADLAARLGASTEVLLKQRLGHADRARRVALARPAFDGARVLVFDDELTTGATLHAALDSLATAAQVHVVVARTFAPADVVAGLLAHPVLTTLATTELSDTAGLARFGGPGLPVIGLPTAYKQLVGGHG
ncbi:hypothetical protein Cs7R123_48660 [Catellatospora sp. TT07R-123]|uniref:phosphoribosyltransferase family protein n=1 Tax=Catellatospora sp. TT07R-123 TaxID=2733863 RepID=UPI001B092891|nr:phosphoribosyltransferase family protein [Catellatospora sp. TT07R-123]GHJ47524.1 hypothetical protein Cs7R123_48660 [Catellatospora sp. TT07R-123]